MLPIDRSRDAASFAAGLGCLPRIVDPCAIARGLANGLASGVRAVLRGGLGRGRFRRWRRALAYSERECTRRAGALLPKLACSLSRCGDLEDPFCGQLANLRRVRVLQLVFSGSWSWCIAHRPQRRRALELHVTFDVCGMVGAKPPVFAVRQATCGAMPPSATCWLRGGMRTHIDTGCRTGRLDQPRQRTFGPICRRKLSGAKEAQDCARFERRTPMIAVRLRAQCRIAPPRPLSRTCAEPTHTSNQNCEPHGGQLTV